MISFKVLIIFHLQDCSSQSKCLNLSTVEEVAIKKKKEKSSKNIKDGHTEKDNGQALFQRRKKNPQWAAMITIL